MAVYVDAPVFPLGRMKMCHMVADLIEELHEMADRIGIDRKHYQGAIPKKKPHYDICKSKRELAIEKGAIEVTSKELVRVKTKLNCECEGVQIGSYDNQVMLLRPKHMPGENPICVDRCLSGEIQEIWSYDITTTGCCCGHNIIPEKSFIGVAFEDIPKMKKLGYEVLFNSVRPNDEDSFKPVSLRL